MSNIPVFKPLLQDDEIKAAVASLEKGWLGMGSSVGEFENKLESLVSSTDNKLHAVALSTGHAALHLALLDIGITDGDEVITPSFNNIADFQAILASGGKPVFCDISEESLCIDIESVKRMVSSKTKAIIIMDYACHLCDYESFLSFQKETGIQIIHDAAHSFGGFHKNKRIGGIFDYTMYSFDPVKNITCIDGGALLIKNEETLMRLREMRLIGMGQPSDVMYQNKRAWTYDVKRLGFRYHMANLHAAIGLAQINRLSEIMNSRLRAFLYYRTNLENLEYIKLPASPPSTSMPLPFIFYLRVLNGQRSKFIEFMQRRGVDTGIHWQAGHTFTLFQDCRKDTLPVTDMINEQIVTIPFHSKMPQEVQDVIIKAIKDFEDEI